MDQTRPEASDVAATSDMMSAREVLEVVRADQRAEDAASARKLTSAARWADLHPPESIHGAASFALPGVEHDEAIAGEGCPSVAEFCIAELGTVLGVSTTSAKRLIGHALELRHRLPRLWAAVHAGAVPAWRARLVAEVTIHATPRLDPASVAWIDAQITPFAHKVGPAQLDRLVAEATARQHPTAPVDPDDPHPECFDERHVTVDASQVGYAGTTLVTAELDLVDALDLDHVLRSGAAELKALGSVESLGARRATALGHLARHQLALDLATGASSTAPSTTPFRPATGLHAARRLDLHLHFRADLSDGLSIDHLGRLDERQRLILLEQVQAWCRDTLTEVRITPVIDLNAVLHAPGYQPTDRQRHQIELRDVRRNLGSHATPWWSAFLASISSSISAGVRNPCRLRGLEFNSAATLSSMPGP